MIVSKLGSWEVVSCVLGAEHHCHKTCAWTCACTHNTCMHKPLLHTYMHTLHAYRPPPPPPPPTHASMCMHKPHTDICCLHAPHTLHMCTCYTCDIHHTHCIRAHATHVIYTTHTAYVHTLHIHIPHIHTYTLHACTHHTHAYIHTYTTHAGTHNTCIHHPTPKHNTHTHTHTHTQTDHHELKK